MMNSGALTGDSINEAVEDLLRQISRNGKLPTKPEEVDLEKLRVIQHSQNFLRYKPKRRKEGEEEADGDSEGNSFESE
jgi:hypothetical protein